MRVIFVTTRVVSLFLALICTIHAHHSYAGSSYNNQDQYQEQSEFQLYPAYSHPSLYYGQQLQDLSSLPADQIRNYLHFVLNKVHVRTPGQPDQIQEKCTKSNPNSKCYPVRSLSYTEARKHLFGLVYLERDVDGGFYVAPIYCDKKIKSGIGPGRIPSTGSTGLNTEHVFPKAHFKRSRSGGRYAEMKSDIHHLAPSLMKVNSFRGSFHFGYPNGSTDNVEGCPESVRGIGAARKGKQMVFLPRPEVRGNVARMLMYFSIRYNVAIQDVEEGMLRQWHESDPVDAKEYNRNNLRYSVQGNRNPFVDYPELAGLITDF